MKPIAWVLRAALLLCAGTACAQQTRPATDAATREVEPFVPATEPATTQAAVVEAPRPATQAAPRPTIRREAFGELHERAVAQLRDAQQRLSDFSHGHPEVVNAPLMRRENELKLEALVPQIMAQKARARELQRLLDAVKRGEVGLDVTQAVEMDAQMRQWQRELADLRQPAPPATAPATTQEVEAQARQKDLAQATAARIEQRRDELTRRLVEGKMLRLKEQMDATREELILSEHELLNLRQQAAAMEQRVADLQRLREDVARARSRVDAIEERRFELELEAINQR